MNAGELQKILIANRGEIAVRIARSCRRLGLSSVAVYSEADRDALHLQHADEAVLLGPAPPPESYLNIERVLAAAQQSGAQAIHPGYGFLSENAEFAQAVMDAGLIWIGPPVAAMEAMASKIRAREIAVAHDIPVLAARTLQGDAEQPDLDVVAALGFPLLLKASAGGGGIGMREVCSVDELATAITEVRAQSLRQFGSEDLLAEPLLTRARHIEVQIVADQHGNVQHLFERDCSAQRRRQKLLEEAPATGLADSLLQQLRAAAIRLACAVNYQGVGTVEFLVQDEAFFLLEMNTRLQVEHAVTEQICDRDLVELQLDVARGRPLGFSQPDNSNGRHAIEARIYAENPALAFAPASGVIKQFHITENARLRIDSGVAAGSTVGHHYDGLLCKLIAVGEDRHTATRALDTALGQLCINGVTSNAAFLRAILASTAWQDGQLHTGTVEDQLPSLLEAGALQTAARERLLIAATLWQFLQHPPAADREPWPGGFRLERSSSWLLQGQEEEISWRWSDALEFEFPDQACQVRATALPDSGEPWVLEIAGIRQQFRVSPTATSLWIWHGDSGSAELRPASSQSDNKLNSLRADCHSPGPGVVLRLLVSAGEPVAAGQALVVLESMKMETTLRANQDGRISSINVQAGELVESEQRLLSIESENGDSV